MAIIHKKPKKEIPYEDRKDITIKKLFLHVTIVPGGQGQTINKLFKNLGVACQFTQRGRGTANKKIRDILGIEDNHKDLVFSLIPENLIPKVNTELEVFFAASEKNKGIGFTIQLDSIISVRVYNFLADML